MLDVAFREDESRVRRGDGAENLAVLRHSALNLLRQESATKGSLATKRFRAAKAMKTRRTTPNPNQE